MEIKTPRLSAVLQSRAEVERMLDAMSAYDRSQVSADWLARLRTAEEGDPWAFAFRLLLAETETEVGTCSFKGPTVDAAASKRVLEKCGFVYAGDYSDPDDGVVTRFEIAVGSSAQSS
jgi:RimJ/RimL family protein N-acetyltransferase